MWKYLKTVNEPSYKTTLHSDGSEKELNEGEVLIKSDFSSINFKDALAVTGKGKILRNFPLTPGIDVAGTIEKTKSRDWKEGQRVLITGCGLGERRDGGYSQKVLAPSEWLVEIPTGLSTFDVMALGTAGFTAALCVHRMLTNGQSKEMGPILVSGASGGVGMLSVDILAGLGFEVWAISSKKDFHPLLVDIGAKKTLMPEELTFGTRPLESVQFGGAIDNVGGSFLEGVLRHTQTYGSVAAVGLAERADFSGTVMPHILRGVSLLGISSTNCPMPLRRELWQQLSSTYKVRNLDKIVSREIEIEQVEEACQLMLERKTHGRTVVKL